MGSEVSSKDQTLSQLYGIRAGLSLISDEYTLNEEEKKKSDSAASNELSKRKELDKSVKKLDNLMSNKEGETKRLESKPKKKGVRIFSTDDDWGVLIVQLIAYLAAGAFLLIYMTYDYIYKSNSVSAAVVYVALQLVAVIAAVSWVLYNAISNMEEPCFSNFVSFVGVTFEAAVAAMWSEHKMRGFAVFIMAAFAVATVVMMIRWIYVVGNDSKKESKDRKRSNENIVKINREIEEQEKKVAEVRQAHCVAEEKKRAAMENYSHISELSSKKAAAIRDTLIEQYGSLIDSSDWQNLDLIIYYISTGRADTIKEALQLVDRQRQTDQIIQAINTASASISNTITTSINNLGGAMVKCFGVLSDQMQKGFDSVNASIKAGNELNAAYMKSFMISNEQLQKSLIANANKNSDVLVSQMDQLIYAHGSTPHH